MNNLIKISLLFYTAFLVNSPLLSNSEIEGFSTNQYSKMKVEYRKGNYLKGLDSSGSPDELFDPMGEYKKDYQGLVDSIRFPSVNLDAEISFDFDIGPGGVDYEASLSPSDIESSDEPFSEIWSAKSIKTRKENYEARQCENEKTRIRANSGSQVFNLNLSGVVDGWIDSLEGAENEIKAQVSTQVSSFFANISRMVSPGYVVEQIISAFATGMAEFTCSACQKTKLGCDNIFLLAEIKKDPVASAAYDKLGLDIGSVQIGEIQKGSYLDVNELSADCPATSIVRGLSGIIRGSGTNVQFEDPDKVQAITEAEKNILDDNAMNACVRKEYNTIIDVIKTAIEASRGSLKVIVETQEVCINENANKINMYDKSDYSKSSEKDFFDKINNFIETEINEPGQKLTNTVMDNIDSAVDLINSKTEDDTDLKKAYGLLLKERDKSLPNSISRSDKYLFIKESIINSPYSTMIKDILIGTINDVFYIKYYSVEAKKSFSELVGCSSGQISLPWHSDNIACIDGSQTPSATDEARASQQKSLMKIRDDYYNNLDFYNKVFMDSLISGVPNKTSLLCVEFDNADYDDRQECQKASYIEHLTSKTPPGNRTCTCNNYGMLLSLIPSPYPTKKLIKNIISQSGRVLLSPPALAKANYLTKLSHGVYELEEYFLNIVPDRISVIQSRQNTMLYQLGIESQEIIKEEVKKYFEILRE